MKRIVLLAGVLCSMGMGYAQKLTHPDLLYTPERIEQVKQRIGQDEQMTSAWKEIKQTAEKELKGNSLNKADYLSLAYLMTGEKVYADKLKAMKVYADKLKAILLKTIEAETWGSAEMLARKPAWRSDLGLAHKAYLSAIAYDAVYNDLSASERKKIAKGLYRLGVEPLLGGTFVGRLAAGTSPNSFVEFYGA